MAEAKVAAPTPRLKALYKNEYQKELQAELKLDNVHQVPGLEKIVVSVGIGKNKDDKRFYEVVNRIKTLSVMDTVDSASITRELATEMAQVALMARDASKKESDARGSVLILAEKIEDYFAPYEEKRAKLLENPKEVRDILSFGASKARKIASEKIREIRDIVGLI